jgi:hypothetical protein
MRRMFYLAPIVLIVLMPDLGYAKSGYARAPIPKPVTATMVPTPSIPPLSPQDLLGGCGKGRFRDAVTHRCRGPGEN